MFWLKAARARGERFEIAFSAMTKGSFHIPASDSHSERPHSIIFPFGGPFAGLEVPWIVLSTEFLGL